MPRFSYDLVRPNDGSPLGSGHISFYGSLAYARRAWADAVSEATDGRIEPVYLFVATLDAQYPRELHTGQAEFDVTITRIGTSSLTVRVEAFQDGQSAVITTMVLVQVDPTTRASKPFDPAERAGLETLLE
jgi:acyl-CoA thioesterase FadM